MFGWDIVGTPPLSGAKENLDKAPQFLGEIMEEAKENIRIYFPLRNNEIRGVSNFDPRHPWRREIRAMIQVIRLARDWPEAVEFLIQEGKEQERSEHYCGQY